MAAGREHEEQQERVPAAEPAVGPDPTSTLSGRILDLQRSAGNQAVTRLIATSRLAIQRIGPTDPTPPTPPAPPGDVVKVGGIEVALDDPGLQRQLEREYVKDKDSGMADFAAALRKATFNAIDQSGGGADDVGAARRVKSELLDTGRLDRAIETVRKRADDLVKQFEEPVRQQVRKILDANEQRTRAEAIRYGIKFDDEHLQSDEPFSTTTLGADMNAGASKGLMEAAKQLLERRKEIDAPGGLREQASGAAMPQAGADGKVPDLAQLQTRLTERERDYDVLLQELVGKYPVLATVTRDKFVTTDMQELAAGSPTAAQAIQRQVVQTLRNIVRVRRGLEPGGDVAVLKIPRAVALAKAAAGYAPGSFEDQAIDNRIAGDKAASEIIDLAVAVVTIALTVVGGPAGMMVVAGISTATALHHASEYMVEAALAGSDLDIARALSQEEPSLLWLALDIAFAAADLKGAAAAAGAAAKLTGRFQKLAPSARKVASAVTAEESAAAVRALEAEALAEGGEKLAKVVARDAEKVGSQAGRAGELGSDLAKVEGAARATATELKGASQAATATGHVHITEDGRLFSCVNPCLDPRDRFARTLATEGELGKRLEQLEEKAAQTAKASAGKSARDSLAKEFATLDDQLAHASLRSLARVLRSGLATLVERYKFLSLIIADEESIVRILAKRTKSHVKGQLLEELDAVFVRSTLKKGEEYIAGHEIMEVVFDRAKDGKLTRRLQPFSDGLVGVREPGQFRVSQIREAKSGGYSASKLEAETLRLDQLSNGMQREIRSDAIKDFRVARGSSTRTCWR